MEALVNPAPSFWNGRRVLITGHTGFKGAWLWLLLRSLGAHCTGLALPPITDPSLATLTGIEGDRASHMIDIRDAAAVLRIVEAASPEIVLHLAAQPLVRRSYQEPVETYATNVMGTIHVLEAVRRTPSVRCVVAVTSDKVYLNRNRPQPYREEDALGGHDPYSSSKACSEFAVESWRLSFLSTQIGLATVRAGNVVGGGDWAADRLVPDLVRAFAGDRAANIRRPAAVRSWIHVLEALAGYLVLAERLHAAPASYSEAWNFGPEDKEIRKVEEVATKAAALWGGDASWQAEPGRHPHEAAELRLDAAKARNRLAWRARQDFDATLRWTVDWYRKWYGGADATALCRAQIEDYLAGRDQSDR